MKEEGMLQTTDFDVANFMDKTFHTFRKTKHFNEQFYSLKWHGGNLINKHYKRNGDQILGLFDEAELPKKIYQARPSVILSIDNEYVTFKMMERISGNRSFWLT